MIVTSTSSQALEERYLTEMRAHSAIVKKVARIYADDEQDRKDLEQEIMLQAWKGFTSFRSDASFGTWLYRVALNVALSWIRSTQRRAKKLAALPQVDSQTSTAANPRVELLYDSIRELSPVDRSLISMHLDGYKHLEIGEALGIGEGAIATRLHRIKARLQQIIQRKTS